MHYPRSTGEIESWFATDADCLDFLDWLRWPGGFLCPECGHGGGWAVADGRYKCAARGKRTSVTAGTLFDRRRTPLTVWFTACWMFATAKDGVSALSVQRALEIGSYPTAWAMLHRLRSVLVRPGRDRLTGTDEVDETYIGGEEPVLRGGRAKGKKSLVGVAIEIRERRGYGRCRMEPLPTPRPARCTRSSPATWNRGESDHRRLEGLPRDRRARYTHERRSQRAAERARGGPRQAAGRGPPGRIAGQVLAAGTHQGSVEDKHLQSYLTSSASASTAAGPAAGGWSSTRVLELAIGHDPVRYRHLVADPKPKAKRPAAPAQRGHPPSIVPDRRPGPGEPLTWDSPVSSISLIPL